MNRDAIIAVVDSGQVLRTEHPITMGEQDVTYYTYKQDRCYVVEMSVSSGTSNVASNKAQFPKEQEDKWIDELEAIGRRSDKQQPLDFWVHRDRVLKAPL